MIEAMLEDVLRRQSWIMFLLACVCVGIVAQLLVGSWVYWRVSTLLREAKAAFKAAAISGNITDRNKARTEEAVRAVGATISEGTAEAGKKAEIAATAAGEAKTLIEEHHKELSGKLDSMRTLVNGGMRAQLQINATLAKRLALQTNRREDADVADLATKRLKDHEEAEAAAASQDSKH